MSAKDTKKSANARRQFTDEFKREAVQILLDGHNSSSVVERLGLSGTGLLRRWKREQLDENAAVASALDARFAQLEAVLSRVENERDILGKTQAILSRSAGATSLLVRNREAVPLRVPEVTQPSPN